MTVVKRVLGATTVALVAVALVAGCGSDTPGPKPTISDGSTAPAGYDATVVPERPADVNTADGAIAFAEYASLVLYYTQATIDPGPLSSIGNLTECGVCSNYTNLAADPTAWELRVATTEPQFTVASGPNYIENSDSWGMIISVAPLTYERYSRPDHTHLEPETTGSETIQVNVAWRNNAWQLQEIDLE